MLIDHEFACVRVGSKFIMVHYPISVRTDLMRTVVAYAEIAVTAQDATGTEDRLAIPHWNDTSALNGSDPIYNERSCATARVVRRGCTIAINEEGLPDILTLPGFSWETTPVNADGYPCVSYLAEAGMEGAL